jgi:hypothetical protein
MIIYSYYSLNLLQSLHCNHYIAITVATIVMIIMIVSTIIIIIIILVIIAIIIIIIIIIITIVIILMIVIIFDDRISFVEATTFEMIYFIAVVIASFSLISSVLAIAIGSFCLFMAFPSLGRRGKSRSY